MPETESTEVTGTEPQGWRKWAEKRDASVSAEHGVLALVGTHWLSEGPGEGIEGLPGLWAADGTSVRLTAKASDGLLIDGVPVEGERSLNPDLALDPTVVTLGARKLVPIMREGVLALRVYDPEADNRRTFEGIERFAYDPELVVPARYESYVHGHVEQVMNADGRERGLALAGDLVFELDGTEHRLAVGRDDEVLSIVFGDATNGPDTFGFRQLAVPAPETGSSATVIDFNRAQLPPCAFSDHFICPVPPVGNRLPLAVTAGEKRRKDRS